MERAIELLEKEKQRLKWDNTIEHYEWRRKEQEQVIADIDKALEILNAPQVTVKP